MSSVKEFAREKDANELLAWIRKWKLVSAPWTAVISISFFKTLQHEYENNSKLCAQRKHLEGFHLNSFKMLMTANRL